jgi:hypothetical protein
MAAIGIPLAGCADQILRRLAASTASSAIASLDGTALLSERAMLAGFKVPGRTSAGGGCRLFDTRNDAIALNLSRPSDRELLPALFQVNDLDSNDEAAIAARIAECDAAALVSRGRLMGLAIAAENEAPNSGVGTAEPYAHSPGGCLDSESDATRTIGSAWVQTLGQTLTAGSPADIPRDHPPRVLDLSALWAGPLASHLLWLAGAHVIKVESLTRPDAMRNGDDAFYALLNQGKLSVALDLKTPHGKSALLSLITTSDIVIEAARPRALLQLGIDGTELVRSTPGLVWMTLTGHGAMGDAANWVGFGDDCGVSGGLSAALRAATGDTGFVGDAIADPLTGMTAAAIAWENWKSGTGARYGLAMSNVVAACLATARKQDPIALRNSLVAWRKSVGEPFPTSNRRAQDMAAPLGADTDACLADLRGRRKSHYLPGEH